MVESRSSAGRAVVLDFACNPQRIADGHCCLELDAMESRGRWTCHYSPRYGPLLDGSDDSIHWMDFEKRQMSTENQARDAAVIASDRRDRHEQAEEPQVSLLANENEWHGMSIDQVFTRLSTSKDGITVDEARERLQRYGPNQLQERKKTSAWVRFLLHFHDPLIYVLLATAGVTGVLQHWVDTGVILGVVVINAIIGFIQESKAERAIESLKQMLSPSALMLRDGRKTSSPATELVPGDVVLLQGGDKVPADVRLFQQKNLQIDEAPLTGESMPVEKTRSHCRATSRLLTVVIWLSPARSSQQAPPLES